MIKGVIFDMDGLMIDTEKLLTKFWCIAANENGYPMTIKHVLEIRSLSKVYAEPYLKGIFGENFCFDRIRARRIELMNDYIDKYGFEVKKGLFTLLDFLRGAGYKTAVATATNISRTAVYLDKIGAKAYFDKIIGGDMIAHGKPEPDIYIEAAKQLELSTDVCLALEDSPNGITSAYRAGCKVIMIPDLTQPDSSVDGKLYGVCESLDKVIDILQKGDAKL
ncbi:MAG: HAD family phosphatase [Ruminococcus sp.]|nr:HAD family phosphatase [Ruminococcus sp.]